MTAAIEYCAITASIVYPSFLRNLLMFGGSG